MGRNSTSAGGPAALRLDESAGTYGGLGTQSAAVTQEFGSFGTSHPTPPGRMRGAASTLGWLPVEAAPTIGRPSGWSSGSCIGAKVGAVIGLAVGLPVRTAVGNGAACTPLDFCWPPG